MCIGKEIHQTCYGGIQVVDIDVRSGQFVMSFHKSVEFIRIKKFHQKELSLLPHLMQWTYLVTRAGPFAKKAVVKEDGAFNPFNHGFHRNVLR